MPQLAPYIYPQLLPPPRLAMSEWADRFRVIEARKGAWRTYRYQRGIMDAVQERGTNEVWVQKSAQIGWTEILLNVAGYHMDMDPCPILIVQPNQKPMAEEFAKDRLSTMIEATPRLRALVGKAKNTDPNNTILTKRFPGGYVTVIGANSAAGMRSRHFRLRLLDEADSYPRNVGKDGDPYTLTGKRQVTYWNRRTLAGGTPLIKGLSLTEQMVEQGDQRQFCYICPHCGEMVWLIWERFDYDQEGTEGAPLYQCPHCDRPADELTIKQRLDDAELSEWRPQAERINPKIASFYIWEGYSPWVKWSEIVANYRNAERSGPEAMQTFYNLSLGRTYEDIGEVVDAGEVAARERVEIHATEDDLFTVPDEVCFLTAGVDFQDDRFECEVVGWGEGERSWSIRYDIEHGQPDGQTVRRKLAKILLSDYRHPYGVNLRVSVACLDTSDGDWTEAICKLCKPFMRRRAGWLPIKGSSNFNAEAWRPPTKPKRGERGKINPYIIGVSRLKKVIYNRLKITDPTAPCYMHFPGDREDKYFQGLTGERLVTTYTKGWPVQAWHRQGYNEPLDCRVYALAGLKIADPDLEELHRELARKASNTPAVQIPSAQATQPARRSVARRSLARR